MSEFIHWCFELLACSVIREKMIFFTLQVYFFFLLLPPPMLMANAHTAHKPVTLSWYFAFLDFTKHATSFDGDKTGLGAIDTAALVGPRGTAK